MSDWEKSEDMRLIDLFEEYLNEAMRVLEAEGDYTVIELPFPPTQRAKDQSFNSATILEGQRNVWLLKKTLMSLVKQAKRLGHKHRTMESWYTLLFFATFASPPTSGCKLDQCPTYPAHRIRKMAEHYLANPGQYNDLARAFQQYQFAHQQPQKEQD